MNALVLMVANQSSSSPSLAVAPFPTMSLTPHRGVFINLTVVSSNSPVWLSPANA